MKQTRNRKFFAKKLLELSLNDNGSISLSKVEAILAALRKKPAHQLKPLLKQLQFYLLQVNQRTEAFFEYAGHITSEEITAIKKSLEDYYGYEIKILQHEDPELIAGFRISIGDDVWETSVAKNLRKLLTKRS